MKNILITGVAGFIGSNVALSLLKQGMSVIGIDNMNNYYNTDWKNDNTKNLNDFEKFSMIVGDILDEAKLEQIFKNNEIDSVVHLAARAGVRPSIDDPKLYEAVNVRGTLNILEAARINEVKKIVFASSSSVYGNQTKTPFSEEDRVDNPVSPYAATKKAGEELCYTYSHLYGISVTCLRFFTVYGPNGRPDMAPYLFTEAIIKGKAIKRFGEGHTGRDYTYIDDIVSGITSAIEYMEPYDIFNLGNSSPVILNDFIKLIEKVTGRTAKIDQHPIQPGDVDITFADISKARALLKYNPKTDLETGLQNFTRWYRKYRLDNVGDKK
jgi:UDP-glucuronate 4-epimerase